MDEAFVCWCIALSIMIYGKALHWKRLERIRNFADKCVLLKWENVLVIFLGLLWLRTVYDLIVIDYIKLGFLTSPEVERHLLDARQAGLSDELINALRIPTWLKVIALLAPIPGCLAFGIVVHTLVQLASEEEINVASIVGKARVSLKAPFLPAASHDSENTQAEPLGEQPPPPPTTTFKAPPRKSLTSMARIRSRSNFVNLVIVVPLVFVVMALRAEIRAIEVMTLPLGTSTSLASGQAQGSGQTQTQDGEQSASDVFERLSTVVLGTYSADLLLAAMFQYFTVLAFVKLCRKVFEESGIKMDDYIEFFGKRSRIVIGTTEFLSINMYIGLGFLKGLLNFVSIAVANKLSRHDAAEAYHVARFCQDTSVWLNPYCTFAAVVVFYSSQVMLRREALKKRLTNPQLEFKGTRWLLMADVQLSLLMMVSQGAKNGCGAVVSLLLAVGLPEDPVNAVVGFIFAPFVNLSIYQAKLLHASLLSFECLWVVRFNQRQWVNKEQHKLLHEDASA